MCVCVGIAGEGTARRDRPRGASPGVIALESPVIVTCLVHAGHDNRPCARSAARASAGRGDERRCHDDLLIEQDGVLVPNYDATIKPFSEGDVVSGEVVRIDKDEVLVDIGYKSEGVIPANELSIRRSVDPADEVDLGESVDALVLTKEDQEGRLVLSKKRARFEKAWRKIEAAAESGEPVEGTVIEVVKGGLILDLGVRGFLPASLVDIRRVHNLDEFKGQTLECKVIELNRSRNNVVLSRRAVLEEERKEVREQILGRLQPGLIVEGKISNIVDFGAFVDLEGIDGLIHISELSLEPRQPPLRGAVDRRDGPGQGARHRPQPPAHLPRASSRRRRTRGRRSSTSTASARYSRARSPRSSPSAPSSRSCPGVEGLVHISELAEHHVESPGEVVTPDQEVWVRILEIDEERRRISLSRQARRDRQHAPARPDARRADRAAAAPQAAAEPAPRTVPDLGASEEVFPRGPGRSGRARARRAGEAPAGRAGRGTGSGGSRRGGPRPRRLPLRRLPLRQSSGRAVTRRRRGADLAAPGGREPAADADAGDDAAEEPEGA